MLFLLNLVLCSLTDCTIGPSFDGPMAFKRSRRASRPQTRKRYNPFFAAACAWQKTLCAAFIPSRLYSQRGTGGGFGHDDLFIYALLKLRHVGYHADEPPPARKARQKLHRLPQ